MNRRMIWMALPVILTVASLACNLGQTTATPTPSNDEVATAVSGTLTAEAVTPLSSNTAPPASATPEPTAEMTSTATDEPALTPTHTAPPQGVSLNCDGTYQRFRITDNGADGKILSVDDWSGAAWVNVWNYGPPDNPFLELFTGEEGLYTFGGCQQLVIAPIRTGSPHVPVDVRIFAWNGATMSQVYSRNNAHVTWMKVGDTISYTWASKEGSIDGGPLSPCEWTTIEDAWDGGMFNQTGSVVSPIEEGCVVSITDP